MPKFTDSFTGTNGSAPNAQWHIEIGGGAGNIIDIQSNELRSYYNSGGPVFYLDAVTADNDGLGTDYTVKIRFDKLGVPFTFSLYDAGGRAIGIVLGGVSPDNEAKAMTWDGGTQAYPGSVVNIAIDTWYWLKMNPGATNVEMSISTDGTNYTTLYSGAKPSGYDASSLDPFLIFDPGSTIATGVTWRLDDYNITGGGPPPPSGSKFYLLHHLRG